MDPRRPSTIEAALAPAPCLYYVHSSLCSTAEGRPECEAIERRLTLVPIARASFRRRTGDRDVLARRRHGGDDPRARGARRRPGRSMTRLKGSLRSSSPLLRSVECRHGLFGTAPPALRESVPARSATRRRRPRLRRPQVRTVASHYPPAVPPCYGRKSPVIVTNSSRAMGESARRVRAEWFRVPRGSGALAVPERPAVTRARSSTGPRVRVEAQAR